MNTLQKLSAICALAVFSAGANATMIEADYSVDANQTDPGLKVNTVNLAPMPISYDLNPGESRTFDLFNIWADEGAVNSDDETPMAIKVNFSFSKPESGTATASGTTGGASEGLDLGFLGTLEGFYQYGELHWNEPAEFLFGPNNDGQIQLSMTNETFSSGSWWGLNNALCNGATVQATLKLIADPTAANVAEPGTLALFGFALLGIGGFVSKRRYTGRDLG